MASGVSTSLSTQRRAPAGLVGSSRPPGGCCSYGQDLPGGDRFSHHVSGGIRPPVWDGSREPRLEVVGRQHATLVKRIDKRGSDAAGDTRKCVGKPMPCILIPTDSATAIVTRLRVMGSFLLLSTESSSELSGCP